MKRRKKESGFAMLLVFLMAASIAITLYIEIPRVAFEAERQRELLLVDRGNQFKRAIQVFYTDKTNNPTHRFPASLDELENFNNHRYLRHRYVDPMTGKDEWRLVHINGGVLTDSVTTQQKTGAQSGQSASMSSGSTYISQQAYLDVPSGGSGDGTAGVNRALTLRRPSEGAGAPGDPNNPSAPIDPNNPAGAPVAGLPPGGPGSSGVPGAPSMPPGMPGQPGQPGVAGLPVTAPGTSPDQSADSSQTGQPGNQPAGVGQPGMGGASGMPGVPGSGQGNMSSQAATMLQNILTTPRPGGMPTNMPGATIGGGIAGVASKYQAEGIMVINQRTKINEWEYIFDATKYRAPPNPIAGAVGTPQQQMGQGNNPNNPATTPFGPGNPTTTGPAGH